MPMIVPVRLKGSVVVITGASRGIGAAFAETLAASGAKVIICARDKAGLDSVCKRIEKKGGVCSSYVVDVTSSAAVKGFIGKVIRSQGRIDALVNNAGVIHEYTSIDKIPEEEYVGCMRTNVDSIFYFLKAVIPQMKKQKSGIIVNISSGAGKRAHAGLSVYAASKFAVEALTQATAKEFEGTDTRWKGPAAPGVSCITLIPAGGVNTGMRAAIFGKADAKKQQSPESVAIVLRDVLSGKAVVPNGADIFIRQGAVTEVRDNLSE